MTPWIPVALELIRLAREQLANAESAGVVPDQWEAARLAADGAEIAKFGASSRGGNPPNQDGQDSKL